MASEVDKLIEPEIERFKLTLRMDATITVYDRAGQATDWLKPGASAACTWRGVPSETELALRYRDLQAATSAILEDVVTQARRRLDEARRGG